MRLLAGLILLTLLCDGMGICCAPLLRNGGHLAVASETAAIVWDVKTHTEYFIRRARFDTDQNDIGFLVPTPTPPTLTAANDGALDALEESLRPRIVTRYHPYYMPVSFIFPIWRFFAGTAADRLPRVSVTVLSEEHVGGYDAAVLRASDTAALTHWLAKHGYGCPPDARIWLQAYVRKSWTITAFKVDETDTDSGGLNLKPVCMAFHADRPFYPYSEPSGMRVSTQIPPDRLLRIFVIAGSRMAGSLDGNVVPWPGAAKAAWRWNHKPVTMAMSPDILCQGLGVPRSAVAPDAWTTAFEDRSSPRPGVADLVFSNAARQETLEPAPEIQNKSQMRMIWLDPLIIIWIVWKIASWRRQKRQTASTNNLPRP